MAYWGIVVGASHHIVALLRLGALLRIGALLCTVVFSISVASSHDCLLYKIGTVDAPCIRVLRRAIAIRPLV